MAKRILVFTVIFFCSSNASLWAQENSWQDLMKLPERRQAGSIEEISGTIRLLREGGFRPEGPSLQLTLEDALEIALRLNPQVRISESNVEGSAAQLDLTLSDYRNQYDLDARVEERLRRLTGGSGFRIDPNQGLVRETVSSWENNELFSIGPTYSRQFLNGSFLEVSPSLEWEHRSDGNFDSPIDGSPGSNQEDRYRLNVRYSLPINSRPREEIRTRIENSQLSAIRSDFSLELQRERITELVIGQYWNIKLLQEELEIQNERLLQARRIEFIIQTQFEFENASEVQVGQANIDVLNNEAQMITLEGNLRNSKERFNLILGVPVETEPILLDELDVSPLPLSASAYIEIVTSTNLQLKDLNIAIRQTENQLRVARLGQQPNLLWSNFFDRNDEGVQNLTTALIFSWPFGDGGATRARVRILEENLKQQEINLWDLERSLIQEVYADLRDLHLQLQRIAILDRNVQQAYVNLENDLFIFTETGRISFREMQDSQIDLSLSRINLARAKVTYNAAKANLLQKVHRYSPSQPIEPLLGLLEPGR